MPSSTKYAKSGDVHIAYQVIGSGDLDLVVAPGFISHVEHQQKEPTVAHAIKRFASFARLIFFDKRGTGLSDPVASPGSLEDRVDDMRAVLDAAARALTSLRGWLESQPGVVVKKVIYRKVREARKGIDPPQLDDLPFVKRFAFLAEEEIRAVYESSLKDLKFLDVPIELSSMLRITLSPWIHDRLKAATKEAIFAVPGCRNLDVRRSTLIGNSEWKKLGDEAT